MVGVMNYIYNFNFTKSAGAREIYSLYIAKVLLTMDQVEHLIPATSSPFSQMCMTAQRNRRKPPGDRISLKSTWHLYMGYMPNYFTCACCIQHELQKLPTSNIPGVVINIQLTSP